MVLSVPSLKPAIPGPPRRYLARPRLLKGLETAGSEGRRLVLLGAGPGSGKTTLVSDHARSAGRRVLWYSASPYDCDVGVFWRRLFFGLRRIVGLATDPEDPLATLASESEEGADRAVAILCDELAQACDEPIEVILDDCQHLPTARPALAGLEALIRYLPDGGVVVLAGRHLPDLRVASFEMKGEVFRLFDGDLSFDRSEVRRFAAQFHGQVDESLVERVLEHSGGWATGVALALQAGDHGPAPGRPELLGEFLRQEVFEPQDPGFKDQLLTCAFLPDLSELACEAAFGDGGPRFLADLEARLAFAVIQGDGMTLVPLVMEFLRGEARKRWPPAEFRRRLSALGRQPDLPSLARTELLILAQDWQAAEDTIFENLGHWMREGRNESVVSLLDRFPPEFRSRSGRLAFFKGELLRQAGNFREAIGALEEAIELAGENHRLGGLSLASLAATRGARGEVALQRAAALEALDLLPPDEGATIASCQNVLGMAHLYDRALPQAREAFQIAIDLYQSIPDAAGAVKVLHNLGLSYAAEGQFARAIGYYREALRQARSSGLPPLPLTFHNLALGLLYLGDVEGAWAAAAQGMALAERLSNRRHRLILLRTVGRLALSTGDRTKSRESLEASLAESIALEDRLSKQEAYCALAELACLERAPAQARAYLDQARACAARPSIELTLLEARVEMAEGKPENGAALLETLDALEPSPFQAFLAAGLGSVAHEEMGNHQQAMNERHLAKRLAAEHGYASIPEIWTRGSEPTKTEAIWELEVLGLGPLEVRVDGREIPPKDFKVKAARLLLVHLLANPSGATRDQLVAILWPHEEPARSALSMVVQRLRLALEPEAARGQASRFILFRGDRYLLNRAVRMRTDVADFRHLLRHARQAEPRSPERVRTLLQGLALYRGPYLDGMESHEALGLERENLRRLAQDGYEELFEGLVLEDDWQGLEQLADQALAIEPEFESGFRAKLGALAMQERWAEARRVADLAKACLERAVGSLEEETSRLILGIQKQDLTVREVRLALASL